MSPDSVLTSNQTPVPARMPMLTSPEAVLIPRRAALGLADAHVAGGGLHGDVAADLVDLDVAAGVLAGERAAHLLGPQVAGGALGAQVAVDPGHRTSPLAVLTVASPLTWSARVAGGGVDSTRRRRGRGR